MLLKVITLFWEQIGLAWKARIAAASFVLSLLGAIYLISTRILAGRPTLLEFQVLVVLCALGMISFTPIRDILLRHFTWIQTRQRAQAETQFLAYLLNILEQAIIVTDPKGKVTYWNPHAERLFGWSHTEVQGQYALEFLFGDVQKAQIQEIKSTVKIGQAWKGELNARRQDGNILPVQLTYTPLYDEQAMLAGMVAIPMDIRERKRRENEAAARHQLSRALRHTTTIDEMAFFIVEQVMLLMRLDGAAFVHYNSSAGEMLVELGSGSLAHWTGVHWISRTAPAQPKDTTVQRDVYDLAELRAAYPRLFSGLSSIAAFHLGLPGEIVGILVISRSTQLSPDDLSMLPALADIVTNAIYRANLQEKIGQQNEQIAAIASTSRALADATDSRYVYACLAQAAFDLLPDICSVSITRYDAENELISCVYSVVDGKVAEDLPSPQVDLDSTEYKLHRLVIQSAQARICNDLKAMHKRDGTTALHTSQQPLPQSALLVPLLANHQVMGLIHIQSYSLNRFEPGDLNLLSYIASSAALALENAHLRGS